MKVKLNNWISLVLDKHESLGNVANLTFTKELIEDGKKHSIVLEDTEEQTTYRITPKTLKQLSKVLDSVATELEERNNETKFENKSQAW